MRAKQQYQCAGCRISHDDYYEAKRCCDPDAVWVCGECGSTHLLKDDADRCCVYSALHDFGDTLPLCLCGAPATDADVRDSKLLGTLIRCRTCIVTVAPGMLTAEAIATGRAA